MGFRDITHYVVETDSLKVVATATSKEEAQSLCEQIQRSADEWNYDNPHREPRYYQVMTISKYEYCEYYYGY